MIGVVLSGYVVAEIVARLFSGYVVDSFDRRGVLLWSLSLFFVFFAGYPVAGTLLMFAIIRTLHGLPFGAVTVANSTAAIDVLPSSRRNEGLGFYGLSNNLSMAIAPSAGVFIYKWVNSFEVLFWLSFFIAAGALFVASRIELPKRERKADKRPVSFDRFFLTRAWLLKSQHHVFCLFVGSAQLLHCFIQQKRAWHYGRHWNIFHAYFNWSHGFATSGRKGFEAGKTNTECG